MDRRGAPQWHGAPGRLSSPAHASNLPQWALPYCCCEGPPARSARDYYLPGQACCAQQWAAPPKHCPVPLVPPETLSLLIKQKGVWREVRWSMEHVTLSSLGNECAGLQVVQCSARDSGLLTECVGARHARAVRARHVCVSSAVAVAQSMQDRGGPSSWQGAAQGREPRLHFALFRLYGSLRLLLLCVCVCCVDWIRVHFFWPPAMPCAASFICPLPASRLMQVVTMRHDAA